MDLGFWGATLGTALGCALACGNTESSSEPSGQAGDGGASGAEAGASGAATAAGGAPEEAVGGAGATGDAGAGGESPIVDPNADEECVEAPDEGTWTESSLEATSSWDLAFAGQLAVVLTTRESEGLRASMSTAGGAWSDWERVDSEESLAGIESVRMALAADGSSGFAIWSTIEEQQWVAHFDADSGFAAPEQLSGSLLVLGDGRALQVSGGSYRVFEGGEWSAAQDMNGAGKLLLAANDVPVLYREEWIENAQRFTRRSLDFASGWSETELVPQPPAAGAYTIYVWEGPGGYAARVFQDLSAQPRSISVRRDGVWSDEGLVELGTNDAGDAELLVEAGGELSFIAQRDGWLADARYEPEGGWREPLSIPRSRYPDQTAAAGSADGRIGLIATLYRQSADDYVRIFERGADGTWYCPRLDWVSGSVQVEGDGQGSFIYAYRYGDTLRLLRHGSKGSPF
jgi:hypothetical protein